MFQYSLIYSFRACSEQTKIHNKILELYMKLFFPSNYCHIPCLSVHSPLYFIHLKLTKFRVESYLYPKLTWLVILKVKFHFKWLLHYILYFTCGTLNCAQFNCCMTENCCNYINEPPCSKNRNIS